VSLTPVRAARPPLSSTASTRASSQTARANPITGPRRSEIDAIREASDSSPATSTLPSPRIGWPDIAAGTAMPKRRRIVGAISVLST